MTVKTTEVNPEELNMIYQDTTTQVVVECEFTTEMVGGQPAGDKELEAFCIHHLKVPENELKAAMARIKDEELGEKDSVQAPLDEIKERESYGVNVIRRDENGPWIGTWMVKAMMKAAASRQGIFMKKRGSKGDMAEMSRILGHGKSKKSEARDRIHLYMPDGKPVETSFKEFMGSVGTPQGRTSIKHHSEIVMPGVRFSYEWRVPPIRIKLDQIKMIMAVISEFGIGSVKAMERGKIKVVKLTVNEPVDKKK